MNSHTKSRGFTLIETLVGSAIFVVLALSAYKAFAVLMDAVTVSQEKLAATTLANEKFEIIRNLTYDDVGIIAGLPAGKIQRTETDLRDGYSFSTETTIRSVDDPFDGTFGGTPNDISPADYKLVELDITCSNCKIFPPLKFNTLVAPHALETATTNGALFIQVINSGGNPIPSASVHIVNTQTNPVTIIDDTTDNGGWLKIVDAPPGVNAYNITASKSGFTEDKTYPLGGIAGANPINPDATVVLQQVTQTSLIIDRLGALAVSSVDSACVAAPAIDFSLTGTKLIGTPAILKYGTQNFTTDATGNFTIPNLEWDTYSTLLNSPAYDLSGATPLPTFSINPNENKTLQLVVVPHADKALLVSIVDSLGNPIDEANVHLEKNGFDENKTTTNVGACPTPGQVFWNGLASGSYKITVSKTGYTTYVNDALDISAAWQNQNIILTLEP